VLLFQLKILSSEIKSNSHDQIKKWRKPEEFAICLYIKIIPIQEFRVQRPHQEVESMINSYPDENPLESYTEQHYP
jgi:hypothetical protein